MYTFFNSVWDSEFFQSIKVRFFATIGFAGAGTAPSIEPIKDSALMLTSHNVIEILQIISLLISILVGITVLIKYFKYKEK
jgi:hypothetical protein